MGNSLRQVRAGRGSGQGRHLTRCGSSRQGENFRNIPEHFPEPFWSMCPSLLWSLQGSSWTCRPSWHVVVASGSGLLTGTPRDARRPLCPSRVASVQPPTLVVAHLATDHPFEHPPAHGRASRTEGTRGHGVCPGRGASLGRGRDGLRRSIDTRMGGPALGRCTRQAVSNSCGMMPSSSTGRPCSVMPNCALSAFTPG